MALVRHRGGEDFIALESAARTATTNSDDYMSPRGARGVYITVDATAIADTPSITLNVQLKDPASEKYETIFDAAAAITSTGTHTYLLDTEATAANDIVEVGDVPVPATWRVRVVHGDGDSITYTVGGGYVF